MPNKSWFATAKRGDVGEIAIYNDIGSQGITAANFAESLAALGNVKTLNVRLNSDGGDISHGMAIYNMLSRHPARKVITVDGIAASMASVILMAGDERVMPRNALVMIHNPFGAVQGEADQIISFGEAMKMMRANMIDAYADATGLSADEISAMADAETWLSADRAKELGFATKIIAPQEMAASVSEKRGFRNVPAVLSGGKVVTLSALGAQIYKLPERKKQAFRSFDELAPVAFANFNRMKVADDGEAEA